MMAVNGTYCFVVVLMIIVGGTNPCLSAKILLSFIRTIHTPSMMIHQSRVCEPLVERGHEVVALLSDCNAMTGLSSAAYSRLITFKTPFTKDENRERTEAFAKVIMEGYSVPLSRKLERLSLMRSAHSEGCRYLFDDDAVIRALREEKFDMMVTLSVSGCDVLLANHLGIPYTLLSFGRRMPTISEDNFGIPVPNSYVPFGFTSTLTDSMSFRERVLNFIQHFFVRSAMEWYMTRPIVAIKDELKIRPEMSLKTLIGKADLCLVQSDFAIEFAQPLGPKWIPIGAITADTTVSPLPSELEAFIQGSGTHGVVLFSLGTVTFLDEERSEVIARIFSELPQRVIWKHKGTRPRHVGNNTLITGWIPQNDVLGHPKTRLMITHGGINGIYEGVAHGVPLLVMPMGGERNVNAVRVSAKGLGVVYDPSTFMEESFRLALKEVLNNESYTVNMKRASGIMNDHLAPPGKLAAFWIEHVIKFGSDHLGLRATELSFVQLNSLDVLAFLVCLLFICGWTLRYVCRRCCRSRCSSSRAQSHGKVKSE